MTTVSTIQREITHAFRFANGMVMVFDQFGEQMPEYQGRLVEMEAKIRANFDGPIELREWDHFRGEQE